MRPAFLAILVVVACPACSTTASPPPAVVDCPDSSTACPATPPDYLRDVQPLIDEYCLSCHAVGGIAGPRYVYTTYEGVWQHRADISVQLLSCRMPQADAGAQPTPAERQTIISWVACMPPPSLDAGAVADAPAD
jgi:hypothetical protein